MPNSALLFLSVTQNSSEGLYILYILWIINIENNNYKNYM